MTRMRAELAMRTRRKRVSRRGEKKEEQEEEEEKAEVRMPVCCKHAVNALITLPLSKKRSI